jgi:hypothetical protein
VGNRQQVRKPTVRSVREPESLSLEFERARSKWRGAFARCWWYAALGFALPFVLSIDWVLQNAIVDRLSHAVSVVLPAVRAYAAGSAFPEITRAYMSLMSIFFPVVTVTLFRAAPTSPTAHTFGLGKRILWGLAVVMLTSAMVFWTFLHEIIPERTGGRTAVFHTLISDYRFGLALLGTAKYCVTSFLVAGSFKFLAFAFGQSIK